MQTGLTFKAASKFAELLGLLLYRDTHNNNKHLNKFRDASAFRSKKPKYRHVNLEISFILTRRTQNLGYDFLLLVGAML